MPVAEKTASSSPSVMPPSFIPDFPPLSPALENTPGMREQQEIWTKWWNGVRQQLFKELSK